MRKTRIVYTIPNFDTAGSGIALLKMATRLDRTRFDPVIVCLHDRGRLFETVRRSGIPVHVYPYLTPQHPRWRFPFRILRIATFFRSLRPDIVFSYHYAPDISEAIAARIAGARFVYIKKNMGWHGPSRRQWRIKTWLSHAITVQNGDMIDLFFKGDAKARIISIGVDQDEFRPTSPDPTLREELFPGVDDHIVLCVANLIPKKGISDLLKGFAACRSRAHARLVVVGNYDTPLWAETVRLMEALELVGRVLFTGKRDDVPRFLSIADLFILASTGDEGAPIAIQEAMASGVPVVTTRTPGNREQLQELPAQLVPPGAPEAISEAIDRFLSISPAERRAIVDRQLDIIDRRYSLHQEVRRHEELYSELVNTTR